MGPTPGWLGPLERRKMWTESKTVREGTEACGVCQLRGGVQEDHWAANQRWQRRTLPASQGEHGPAASLTWVFRSPEMGKNKSLLPEATGLRYFVVVIPGLESNHAKSSLSRCCYIHSKLHLGLLCSAGSKHKGQNVRLLSVITKHSR